jgi:hypothetical protein
MQNQKEAVPTEDGQNKQAQPTKKKKESKIITNPNWASGL